MATIIQTDGTEKVVDFPKTDRLEFMQRAVGGYIEAIRLRGGRVMWVNEEGMLKGLPTNEKATEVVVDEAPQYIWGPGHKILGPVLIQEKSEEEEEED